MTTRDTKFVFDDGFIRLYDLEAWHSRGYLKPGDSITVIDKGCGAKHLVIDELIKLHGSQFPFRRGNTPAVTGMLDECVYTSLQLLEEWKNGRKIGIELSEDVRRVLGRSVPVDWPLFNVDNEPEEDRITGNQVLEEMKKLSGKVRRAKSSPKKFAKFFSFLDKKIDDNGNLSEAICRLCQYYPSSAELFFHHLFKFHHTQYLQNEQVSKRSFEFWSQKFDEYFLECESLEDTLADQKQSVDLENNQPTINGQEEEPIVQENDELEETFTRDRFLSLRHLKSEYSEIVEKVKLMEDEEKERLEMRRSRKLRDFNQLRLSSKKYSHSSLCPYLPLFNTHFDFWDRMITGEEIIEEMEKLRAAFPVRAWTLEHTKFFRFVSDQFYGQKPLDVTTCTICAVSTTHPKSFFDHMFSEEHIEKLSKCTVPKIAFDVWMDQFEKCEIEFGETLKDEDAGGDKSSDGEIQEDEIAPNGSPNEQEENSYTKEQLLSLRHWKNEFPMINERVKSIEEEEMEACKIMRSLAVRKLNRLRDLARIQPTHMSWTQLPLFSEICDVRDRSITGEGVFQEMRKLRAAFPVGSWTPKHTEFFRYVSDQFFPQKPPHLETCMICYVSTTTPKSFFDHMFDEEHITKLSKYEVTKISFEVWKEQFGQCEKECGRTFFKIPADDNEGGQKLPKDRLLELRHLQFEYPELIESVKSIENEKFERLEYRAISRLNELKTASAHSTVFHVPLFTELHERACDRMITGEEIVEEMNTLRAAFPVGAWTLEHNKFFHFVSDKILRHKPHRKTCSICNENTTHPKSFFDHMFSEKHIKKLSKCTVSRVSFKAWMDQFEQCEEECGRTFEDAGGQNSDCDEREEAQEISHLDQEESSYNKDRLLSLRHLQTQCPELIARVKQLTAEGKEKGGKNLQAVVRSRELNKLNDLRHIAKTRPCHHSWVHLPLFSNKCDTVDRLITGNEIMEEMEKLKAAFPVGSWTPEHTEFFRFVSDEFYPQRPQYVKMCTICNASTTTPESFFKHMFGQRHIRNLSGLIVSINSFKVWMEQFEQCERECGKTVDGAGLQDTDIHEEEEAQESSHLDQEENSYTKDRLLSLRHLQDQCSELIERVKQLMTEGKEKGGKNMDEILKRRELDDLRHYANNRPGTVDRLITGNEVIEEMEKLKAAFPVGFWTPEHTGFFRFVSHEFQMCTICNASTTTPESFFKHMFGKRHIRNLSALDVSINSFEVWMDRFKKCERKCGRTFAKIPADDNEGGQKQTRELQGNDMSAQEKTIVCEDSSIKQEETNYTRDQLLSLRRLQNNNPTLIKRMQLIAEEQEEKYEKYRSWALNQLNRLRASSKTYSTYTVWWFMPLFTDISYDFSDRLITGEEIIEEMNKLKAAFPVSLWTPEHRRFFRFVSDRFYPPKPENANTCMICAVTTTHPKSFFDHMFSEEHIEKLSKCTVSRSSFEIWMEQFVQCEKELGRDFGNRVQKSDSGSSMPKKPKLRVPLLDPLPEDLTPSFKLSYDDIHSIYARFQNAIKKCTEEQLNVAKKQRNAWYCSQCDDASQPVMLANKLYAVTHIFSRKHLEKMHKVISSSDLDYWIRWLIKLNPQLAKETSPNAPRISLLDQSPPDEESVTEERFESVLDECQKIFDEHQKTILSNKMVTYNLRKQPYCKFCSNMLYLCKFTNNTQILVHILSPSHRQNMKQKATESDLQHWYQYLLVMKEPRKMDETNTKKSEQPKNQKVMTCQKQLDKVAVCGRPANEPPIPLLDFERSGSMMSESAYRSKYEALRILVTISTPDETVDQVQICTCYHCPDSPSFKTQWEVIQHVFNGEHAVHICYTGNRAAFRHYERLLEEMESKPLSRDLQSNESSEDSEYQKAESIPTDPVQNPLEISKTACLLPLFASNHSWRKTTDTVCIGPTREQMRLVEKFQGECHTQFVQNQTLCGTCHLDMSSFSMSTVVQHAFSVEHLNQFQIVGGRFMSEDFDWWMTKLNIEFEHEEYEPLTIHNQRLGGFRPIPNSNYGPSFGGFTAWHKKEFENLDESKVALVNSEILEKFAACVYCNKWLLTGRDVLCHYIAEQHFEMVKKRHAVSQAEVDKIMHYVHVCQKETKCVVM